MKTNGLVKKSTERSSFHFLWMFAAFALSGSLIYSNTLESPFVFDDIINIVENKYIHINMLDLGLFKNIFSCVASSRPAANISLSLNYYFGGLNLTGYHLVNTAIHIITAMILFLLLRVTLFLQPARKSKLYQKNIAPETIAFITTLLWMVNPLHTESVTYIVQRMNSMAAMFYLLSFWCYINARKHQRHINLKHNKNINTIKLIAWFFGSAVSGILAMASKENAITLPAFILLYEWFFFQNLRPLREMRAWRWALIGAVIIIIAAAIYLGKDPVAMIQKTYVDKKFTMAEHVISEWRVMIYYISLIVFPSAGRLNLDYDYPVSQSLINPPTTTIALIAIISLLVLAVYAAKRDRILSFAILWFLGNLLLESSVLGLALVFEHRTYLPSMMVCLIITMSVTHLIKYKKLAIGVLTFTIIAAGFSTWQRNIIWQDATSLWNDTVSKSPNLARPHHFLAQAHEKQKKFSKAIGEYKNALLCDPNYYPSLNNLGLCYKKLGEFKKAFLYFSKAIQKYPLRSSAHINLGSLFADLGNINNSIVEYRAALKVDPKNINALNNMGESFIKLGKYREAEQFFQKAVNLNPANTEVNLNLGVAYANQNRTDEAIRQYKKVIDLDPGLAEVYNNLGVLMVKKKDLNMAGVYFRKALKINPKYTNAQNNIFRLEAMNRRQTAILIKKGQ